MSVLRAQTTVTRRHLHRHGRQLHLHLRRWPGGRRFVLWPRCAGDDDCDARASCVSAGDLSLCACAEGYVGNGSVCVADCPLPYLAAATAIRPICASPTCASTRPTAAPCGDAVGPARSASPGDARSPGFPSTGADGAFAPTEDTVLDPGIYHFTTVDIPAGVTVTTRGEATLELRASGPVNIAGTIDLSGSAAAPAHLRRSPSRRCRLPDVGGPIDALWRRRHRHAAGPGRHPLRPSLMGGPGGQGAPGTRDGHDELCGHNGGGAGFPGTNGLAHQGRRWWRVRGWRRRRLFNGAGKVGGCSQPYAGEDGAVGAARGGGGGSIGALAATDLAVTHTFRTDPAAAPGWPTSPMRLPNVICYGGGGGGGGGGALRVASRGDHRDGRRARQWRRGGRRRVPGGWWRRRLRWRSEPRRPSPRGVSARSMRRAARGAAGGGGDGGPGRIQIAVDPTSCALTGTFDPPLVDGCAPTPSPGLPLHTYIAPLDALADPCAGPGVYVIDGDAWTDASALFAGATQAAPATIGLAGETLYLCEGTYYGSVRVSAPSTIHRKRRDAQRGRERPGHLGRGGRRADASRR